MFSDLGGLATYQVNCQPIFDVVAFEWVIVLHDFSSKNETKLFWFSFKLLSYKRLELQTKKLNWTMIKQNMWSKSSEVSRILSWCNMTQHSLKPCIILTKLEFHVFVSYFNVSRLNYLNFFWQFTFSTVSSSSISMFCFSFGVFTVTVIRFDDPSAIACRNLVNNKPNRINLLTLMTFNP